MTHTVVYNQISATDPRLGRNQEHDSRSRAFAYAEEQAAYANARHTSSIPTLNQGNVGACVPNSGLKNLTYIDQPGVDDIFFWESFSSQFPNALSTTDAQADERVALVAYSDCLRLDGNQPYDPNDPSTDLGSSGLTIARVLKNRGWISGYQHAFSLSAALTALSRQAVIVGTNWYTGQFDPTSSGELVATGKREGAHEYVLDQIDVDNERVWMQNSWGNDWGQAGRAWMKWSMLEQLLGENGDCTIFVPLNQPAPTPAPQPEPTPAPDDPQATFVAQAEHWINLRHSSAPNTLFEKQTQAYLDWLKTHQG